MTDELKTEPKKKKETSDGTKKGPQHVIRDGGIAAMIWRRESATGFPYYEFSLSRSWKSVSSGKTGYSQNYFAKNGAQLMKVIELASQWIGAGDQDASMPLVVAHRRGLRRRLLLEVALFEIDRVSGNLERRLPDVPQLTSLIGLHRVIALSRHQDPSAIKADVLKIGQPLLFSLSATPLVLHNLIFFQKLVINSARIFPCRQAGQVLPALTILPKERWSHRIEESSEVPSEREIKELKAELRNRYLSDIRKSMINAVNGTAIEPEFLTADECQSLSKKCRDRDAAKTLLQVYLSQVMPDGLARHPQLSDVLFRPATEVFDTAQSLAFFEDGKLAPTYPTDKWPNPAVYYADPGNDGNKRLWQLYAAFSPLMFEPGKMEPALAVHIANSGNVISPFAPDDELFLRERFPHIENLVFELKVLESMVAT
jgi:hypothetical protein